MGRVECAQGKPERHSSAATQGEEEGREGSEGSLIAFSAECSRCRN
jgi:hypothetical protein